MDKKWKHHWPRDKNTSPAWFTIPLKLELQVFCNPGHFEESLD
jgi:hypothetical protein